MAFPGLTPWATVIAPLRGSFWRRHSRKLRSERVFTLARERQVNGTLGGLALVLAIPGLTPWAKDLALLRSAS